MLKLLYCPQKTKQAIFSSLERATDYRPSKRLFFGTVQHCCKKGIVFWDRTLCCPKTNPILFCKSAVLSQKNQKNNLLESWSPRGPRTSKDCLFCFVWDNTALLQNGIGFGAIQHICKKINKNTALSKQPIFLEADIVTAGFIVNSSSLTHGVHKKSRLCFNSTPKPSHAQILRSTASWPEHYLRLDEFRAWRMSNRSL